MAKELAHFKNFAKLKDTSIAFNDITVLAGKPGVGKSYVMKFMYAYSETISSIVSGAYKMHFALMDDEQNSQMLVRLARELNKYDNINEVNKYLDENDYINAYEVFRTAEISEDKFPWHDIFENSLSDLSEKQKKSLIATEEEKFDFIFRNILESIFGSMEQISSEFSFEYNQSQIEYCENKLDIEKLNISQEIESAIFVETPLILEFEKFLPKDRFETPYHIDSLLKELNKNDFSFTSNETSKFINNFRKASGNIINGNISKGNQGFSFESNNGKTYNIINASSGTKSIGLLQYLVTNKVLKKGSVLYWEEPEVHLHPLWQLKMIELFVELMNAGVKIVFSTHSPYMCDYLNAISQKKDFKNRVSFNLLNENDEVVENYVLESDEDWNKIQAELLDPLEEIMWEYI